MDILKAKADLSCTEEDLVAFVKYRNDITHGRYRTVDSVIAKASLIIPDLRPTLVAVQRSLIALQPI
jgi:hypothetical protein